MTSQVVVLGSGYAGAGAVSRLESELREDAHLTWISDVDYHLVLHESHRCIRDPSVREKITIPVETIASRSTEFVEGSVVDIDTDERAVELADDRTVDYDYLLVALGSRTAFFGIDGLRTHAHTLKSLDDALAIHDAIRSAARDASRTDPARVLVGGAGLSGIQVAGEVAAFRDERGAPLEIRLVEGLEEVLPNGDPELQRALRSRLENKDVDVLTGEFVSEVDDTTVYLGEDDELDYDVLVWTGGITGRDAVANSGLDQNERNHRIDAGRTFRTSDDRVFAIGDCALVEQNDEVAPPTAQAAWQAADVAGANVARAVRGESLKEWHYHDKGTVVSVGDEAVAHGVDVLPVSTFGGFAAETLKKLIAARWIADVGSVGKAISAWPAL
ncbi:MAG: NAD(P)/FAD-dependent oxidoreductase [Haloarculaceae archaeon]